MADALGNRAVRVRPGGVIAGPAGGVIVDEIAVGTGAYACVLGGDDGRTLYLCMAPGFAEHERRDTREARPMAVEVEVPGT